MKKGVVEALTAHYSKDKQISLVMINEFITHLKEEATESLLLLKGHFDRENPRKVKDVSSTLRAGLSGLDRAQLLLDVSLVGGLINKAEHTEKTILLNNLSAELYEVAL